MITIKGYDDMQRWCLYVTILFRHGNDENSLRTTKKRIKYYHYFIKHHRNSSYRLFPDAMGGRISG